MYIYILFTYGLMDLKWLRQKISDFKCSLCVFLSKKMQAMLFFSGDDPQLSDFKVKPIIAFVFWMAQKIENQKPRGGWIRINFMRFILIEKWLAKVSNLHIT